MTSHALHDHPARSRLSRWVIVGFLSGAASVLIFHQGAAVALHALELTARAPYSVQPTNPFGVPQLGTGIGLALFGRPRVRRRR